jgi:hypothetical protein
MSKKSKSIYINEKENKVKYIEYSEKILKKTISSIEETIQILERDIMLYKRKLTSIR